MALIYGALADRLIRLTAPEDGITKLMDGSAYAGKSKLEVLLGKDFLIEIKGLRVLDFGCGLGDESIEMAQHGADVTGLDIVEAYLTQARAKARDRGLKVNFTNRAEGLFNVILSFDAFEHYANPAQILNQMSELITPDGVVIASFGPTWYHPLGGHLFSFFPWSHIVFSENALIRWRREFKTDGALRFSQVEGGLNQLTIRRFEQIVSESPFRIEKLETVPIKRVRRLHNRFTREFFTSTVRCRLKLKT